MKSNFIHVCFVIDESGSMYSSKADVEGGFKKVIDEQKANQNGQCSVSLFTFNDTVRQRFLGINVQEISELSDYSPCGCTAMNDGIGTAIDKIGAWLSAMPESERPEKNLIVIMTDGMENASTEYSLKRVREMIEHQTWKYSWQFMYIGTDITTTKDADDLGISLKSYSSRSNYGNSYDIINTATTMYRNSIDTDCAIKSATLSATLNSEALKMTAETSKELGIDILGNTEK